MKKLVQRLRQAVLVPEGRDTADGLLLERFIERRDPDAFEALVRRHGPMVFGLCRRVLANHHDAEDAFQATFLVLARKAASVRPHQMVGSWLYGVAYRTALKARSALARRRTREKQVAAMPEPEAKASVPPNDLRPLLDRELSHLPDRYRAPILLCDFEGKTHREAAEYLGWPEGTLSVRLMRARSLLSRRLVRQGVTLSAGALAVVLAENAASADVPAALVPATARAAVAFASGGAASNALPNPVLSLAEGVLRTMHLSKLKLLAGLLLVAGAVCAGAAVSAHALGTRPEKAVELPAPQPPAAVALAEPKAESRNGGERSNTAETRARALLRERLAVLKAIAEQLKKAYEQSGKISATEVWKAELAVRKAELELAESDRERVAIHEKIVALAKDAEKLAQASFDAGRCPPWQVLAAKADRLEAEVALLRAREKAK